MLRGRGIPLFENEKRFLGFLVSWLLGFVVSLVSWFVGFLVSKFQSLKFQSFDDPLIPKFHSITFDGY